MSFIKVGTNRQHCQRHDRKPKERRDPYTHKARVALALGGGAARGFAHIGVIQVLEENGIHPDMVVGTSAGSLVAALYAAGRDGKELEKVAETMDESALTDYTMPFFSGPGLVRGDALARYVRSETGGRNIDQTKIPLGIVATDVSTGQPIVFRHGDLGTAVRASSAVPGVFFPVEIGRHTYVDGGLSEPVPVRAARGMGADVVIAVDISESPEGQPVGDTVHMLLKTFTIMGHSINELALKEADVVVRPNLMGVSGTDFTDRLKNIRAGRQAALAALPEIKAKIAQPVPL